MEKFTSMLTKLGLRGSSDDGLDGRRSAQSTPRLKRGQQVQCPNLGNDQKRSYGSLSNVQAHRVNNGQQHRHRDHSLDPDLAYHCRDPSLEHVSQGAQQRQMLNRSWDCDRVLGLDRSWEAERAKGIELLYRSMEREKQREKEKERLHGKERHDNRHHDNRGRSRHRRHKHKSRHRTAPAPPSGDTCEHWVMGGTHRDPLNLEILEPTPTLVEQGPNSPDSRGRLEREVEDLNQQLAEEKEKHRRDKIQVAKLQREVSRHKSDGPLRENLMKELDRERMLRADAEQRLKDMTYESDTTKERLMALQNEFKKMEEMVRSMVSYKHKIDALKQEKSNLITSYEASVAKYQSHVKNLDRENRILLAEIKKLQSQPSSSRSSEEAESKTKVLLERLKMLEAENSALVLENETQRQQYEKCLDSIANQVVQALLTQKGLREECGKLQKRVVDLEQQNKQLNQMFQQRIRFASDSLLQSALTKISNSMSSGSGSSSACRSPGGSSGGSHTSLIFQQQLAALSEAVAEGGAHCRPGGEQAASACSFDSIFSLQSLCSDYNDQSQGEECLGKPEMSSPPPWLREKISFPFKAPLPSSNLSESSRSSSENPNKDSPLSAKEERIPEGASEKASSPKDMLISHEYSSELETEFPVNNASPKMKHVFYDRHGKQVSLDVVVTAQTDAKSDVSKSKNIPSLNAREVAKQEGDGQSDNKSSSPDPQKATKDSPESECDNKDDAKASNNKTLKCKVCEKRPSTSEMGLCLPCGISKSLSPGQELLRLTDSFNEKFIVNEQDGLPQIQPRAPVDLSSDEDTSSSRAVSHTFSAASTVSLNELLERELDEMETPNEEGFSFDNLPTYESLQARLEGQESKTGPPEGTRVPDRELMEEPVRDNDPDRSDSKLSKSSSQSESSILSQRPMRVSGTKQGILSREGSRETSPSIRRPSSLSLSQECLINTDTELEQEETVKTGVDGVRMKTKISSPSKSKKSSSHKEEVASPKHKGKSSSVKSACGMEPHPLKLYNVISPPGEHESILEKFKKQPPKVKPKPSIAMCLKKNSRDDEDEDEIIRMKPYSKRPETDGQECSPKESHKCDFKEIKPSQLAGKCEQTVEKFDQKTDKSETPECSGTREPTEVSDQMTVSSSSGSPDSAMQQSFSSSSSDNTLSDKPSCRDDGYLSNSTISMSSNDIPGDLLVTQLGLKQQGQGNIKRRSKTGSSQPLSEAAQQIRRRSQPQCGSGEPHYENTNMNANPSQRKAHRFELSSDKSKSLPPGMKLGRVFSRDSTSSMESTSSIENNSIGKVRDIKAFFEGKVDEKLKSRLLEMEENKKNDVSDRMHKSCDMSSQSEDKKDCDKAPGHSAIPYDLRQLGPLEKCHSEDGLMVPRSPNVWRHRSVEGLRTKPVPPPKPSRKKKPVISRLRRSRSDTTLYQCMSELHREDNKALHIALRRDWMKFCCSLTSHKRAQSLPLNKEASIRKRSVSPRLLPRRSQRHHSQEVIRSHGEGSENRIQAKGRPEAIGCAGPYQMAASYPCEGSPHRHWGRPRRHHSTEKNLAGWSSDSDDGSDSGLSGSRQGEREGPSTLLPEWASGQFSHQALGIRRFDKSNNAHKRVPTSNMNLLSPPGGKPEATSPTGGTNASTYKHNNQMVFMSRRQAGGGSSGHHPRSKSESKADQKPRAEAVFNRCYQRGEIGKSNGGRISSQSKIFAMRQASPHCEGRLGEDLAGLSQSLEEFEREYTEMCQTQAKGSKNGALNDSDDFATASLVDSCSERKANDVRDIEFRVPSCQSPTEQGVHCRSPNVIDGNVTDNKLTYEQSLPADSEVCQSYPGHGTAADDEMENEKSEIDKLSKEDIDDELSERKIVEESKNPDKTNKDKMVSEGKEKSIALSADDICDKALNQDLENLSLRECNIRDSLLSLDSLNTSEGTTDHESQAFHPFECHSESRKEGMADLMSEDLENVESCGDSSTESDPEMLTAEKRAEMLDTLVSGFSSAGEEEDDYVYLQEGPESAASGAGAGGAGAAAMEAPVVAGLHDISDGKHKVRVTPICRTKVDRKTFVRYSDPEHHAIKSFEFLDDMSQASSASQSEDDKGAKHAKNSKKAGSKTKAPTKGTFSMRRAADGGAISPPGDKKGKQSPSDSGKARPLNPKVKSLREEGRKETNRLSNSSFDAATFGSEEFSLSDSCCEDFSSGISDNDSKA